MFLRIPKTNLSVLGPCIMGGGGGGVSGQILCYKLISYVISTLAPQAKILEQRSFTAMISKGKQWSWSTKSSKFSPAGQIIKELWHIITIISKEQQWFWSLTFRKNSCGVITRVTIDIHLLALVVDINNINHSVISYVHFVYSDNTPSCVLKVLRPQVT